MTTAIAISRELLFRQMVEAAILAPSAENTQPWRFSIGEDSLIVSLDASRRLPSDVGGMLALTGIGAAIENAVICARQHELEPEISYRHQVKIDGPSHHVPVAKITLADAGSPDPLFPYLKSRCTTRRMESKDMAREVLDELSASIDCFPNVRVDWLTTPREIRPLAKLVGAGNRIRFEHEPFHGEFYQNMRFSREEVRATRDGLDVETLQLPLGVERILKALRIWRRMRTANAFGFSRTVARQAASEVRSSGAVGLLTVEVPTRDSFLEGGRALERLWLSATALGLGFHPTASLPVFLAFAQRTDGSALLANHRRLAMDMSKQFCSFLPHLAERTLHMVFRVGFAEHPRVRSLRRPIIDFLDAPAAAS